MFIIEMIDSWDRTVKTWCVDYTKETVENFVNTLNKGLLYELEEQANSHEQYYFYYEEVKLSELPSEEEIIEIIKPSNFEFELGESNSNSGLTLDMIQNWDMSSVTDMSEMFKDM